MLRKESLPITRKGDVNLVCGTYLLPEVYPELGNIFAPEAKTIHIDLNAYEIAKNHSVDIGLVSHLKLTLGLLAERLRAMMTPDQAQAARRRVEEIGRAKQAKEDVEREKDWAAREAIPLAFSRFAENLAEQLPGGAIIFDEAPTNSPHVTRYIDVSRPPSYFLTRGGSLGVGIPGAIGAKLANPEKTVVGFTGDGAAMYTIQGPWTAVRHGLDVKFVVCNNRPYHILQINLLAYWIEQEQEPHGYPLSFDLSQPRASLR